MNSQTSRNLSMTYDSLIDQTAAILRAGKTILYPTDTIWGIGCDATNNSAIERIYDIKNREKTKSFILLVSSIEMLKIYIQDLHPRVETLLVHHQRPLTLVYPNPRNLPPMAHSSSDHSVAIRVVKNGFCSDLIEKLNRPIVATSANKSFESTVSSFTDIREEIKVEVDYVVPYEHDKEISCSPSVIANFNKKGELTIIRN